MLSKLYDVNASSCIILAATIGELSEGLEKPPTTESFQLQGVVHILCHL
ncbi:hypothetical protein [Bacillus cereus]